MTNPPRILVVDDDLNVVKVIKKSLERSGYSVTTTTSGKRALALLEDSRPDLLILDLTMPPPDGFELLEIERVRFPYLRILVISGYLEGALLPTAKLLGAFATLGKPFTSGELVAKVQEVLGT